MKRVSIFVVWAIFAIFFAPFSANAQKNNVLFIVDISGSMREVVSGEQKIVAAKKAFQETMNAIPASTNVGLMVFGQRRAKDCTDIEVLSPLGQRSAKELANSIENFEPKGETPIADALLQSRDVFADLKGDNNSIVLITDGREECKGNVCDATDALKAAGIGVKVHIVGLGHTDEDRKAVECITKISGGRYVAANNAKTLTDALNTVTRVEAKGWPPSADSLKLVGYELLVGRGDPDFGPPSKLSFGIENRGGIGLGVAIREYSFSAGPCTPLYITPSPSRNFAVVSGLSSISAQAIQELLKDPNPTQKLQYLPAAGKVNGTISMSNNNCNATMVTGIKSVPVTVTVVVSFEKNILVLPLSVDSVPVRMIDN